MKKMHLIYTSDANYVMPMTVSASSVAYGANRLYTLVFHILDLGLTDAQWTNFVDTIQGQNENVEVQRIKIDAHTFSWLDAYHGGWATYARLFAFHYFDDTVDWALYVDGDTLCVGDVTRVLLCCDPSKLVVGSLDPLPIVQMERPDCRWCKERGLPIDVDRYICNGVMLLNVRALKKFDFERKAETFLRQYGTPPQHDQTVVNTLCFGQIAVLPRPWGVFSVDHADVDWSGPVLIHYAGEVPWRREKINRLMSDVVMLWYAFAERHLQMKILEVSSLARVWRRLAFLALKHNQWIVRLHPYLASKLRNVYGIPRNKYNDILESFERQ